MVCEMAIEDVLTCVDFIAKAAGVGLLLSLSGAAVHSWGVDCYSIRTANFSGLV